MQQSADPPPAAPSGPPPARSRSDARTALALAGPVLFTPAALALATREWTFLGVPSVAAYVFATWLVGIVLTRLLAR